jgi:hypothetical protein
MEHMLPPVLVENLQVGPRVGMVKDLDVKKRDVVLEETIADITLCALHEGGREEHTCPADGVPNPTEPHHEFPKIEIQKLSSIVVNNDMFLFLWDLENFFGLRLDECLDVITRLSTLKVDDSGDRLSDILFLMV